VATVAVIADTHLPRGARRLPDACVERLRAADLILHAGDVVSLTFFGELCAIGPPVEAVHGNMDEPAVRDLLPPRRVVEVDGLRIGIVHDGGRREREGGPAVGALSRLRGGRLRPHPRPAGGAGGRDLDPQPGLADGAPPSARAHDAHAGARSGRDNAAANRAAAGLTHEQMFV
jgi:hypothetical protein